jgi:hypothetical protein
LPSAPVIGDWIQAWQANPKASTPMITLCSTCSCAHH